MSDDFRRLVEAMKKNHRPHAGHFSWVGDRDLEEHGVLREIVQALSDQYGLELIDPRVRGRGNDPPDCEARLSSGGAVAIELTELVDGNSIQIALDGGVPPWKSWNAVLVPAIQKRIREKGATRSAKGGPYEKYLLVIYTDEPALPRSEIERILEDHVFDDRGLITDAYILVSYAPETKSYPCVRLRLTGT